MKYLSHVFSLLVFSFVASAGMALAQVASVFELSGTATAAAAVAPGSPAAAGRTLRQGDNVNQGETITTGPRSSIVLRFLDGQIVSLAGNSTFSITTYTYNTANPAQSNVLLSLINGGMRAVTGLIGKARPQAVAYRAAGATIGIRGTDVSIAVNGGTLILNTNTGLISFTPAATTANPNPTPISVVAGQGVFSVRDGPIGQGATVTVGNPKKIQAALAAAIAQNPAAAAEVATIAAVIVAVVPYNSPTANAVRNAVESSAAVTIAFNEKIKEMNFLRPVRPLVATPGRQGTRTTVFGYEVEQNQLIPRAVVVPPPANTGTGSAVGGSGGTPLNCNVVSPATKPAGCP
ncbi:MAG: FecR domain-containing protein [Burkholderiales bacterium]|jgi:hypothetical protein